MAGSHPSLGEEGRRLLHDLLHRYKHVFPVSGEPVTGRTTSVQHKILTSDARPVRCGPRRLAPAGLQTEQTCVKEMNDNSLRLLGNQLWFSTMDLASGYWQVAMSPEAKRNAAFVTNEGLFQFRVIPFGLCNARATFEPLMDRVGRLVFYSERAIRTCNLHLVNSRIIVVIIVICTFTGEHRDIVCIPIFMEMCPPRIFATTITNTFPV